MPVPEITPDDVLAFWFPEPAEPDPAEHVAHWVWRMRSGAHDAVIERFCDLTRRAVAISVALADEAPANLRDFYRLVGAKQPALHRAVVAVFGRYPHRNAILGRPSTPEEAEYLAKGEFPHQSDLTKLAGL